MNLLIAGNLVNNGYYLAKLLRANGISVDLLTKRNSQKDDPKFFDSEMVEYPDWIKFWNVSKWGWKIKIINLMRKYDLIQASTELPIFALMSRQPFIALTTGSDIIELAHKNNIRGFLIRLAYKKAKTVVFGGPYMYPSIEKLNIKKSIFIPLIWDYQKFYPSQTRKYNKEKFTIFHPTGHRWNQKKNDIFLRSFARLAKNRNDIHLILIKRGPDFAKSMEILKNANVEDKISVIPHSIPQKDLQKYYIESDVVVDQFVVGSTGLIGQEAMSCEKPVIQYVNKELYEKFYAEVPPIINASSEKEIYDALLSLIEDRDYAEKIGKLSRKWLLKYHDAEKIIKKYIYLYQAIADNVSFKTLKSEIQKY